MTAGNYHSVSGYKNVSIHKQNVLNIYKMEFLSKTFFKGDSINYLFVEIVQNIYFYTIEKSNLWNHIKKLKKKRFFLKFHFGHSAKVYHILTSFPDK